LIILPPGNNTALAQLLLQNDTQLYYSQAAVYWQLALSLVSEFGYYKKWSARVAEQ
jgi:hypothetical protein